MLIITTRHKGIVRLKLYVQHIATTKKKYIILITLFFFIYYSQCIYKKILNIIIHASNSQNNFQEQAINTVPIPPKIQTTIDWRKNLLTKIKEIISLIQITDQKNINSLFVNIIENNSNYTLDVHQTTKNLINLLNELNDNQLIIINSNISHKMYNSIKLFNKNLTPRGINIKLARHIHAKYVLHSTIYNHLRNINITLELILVQNGEIIWSDTTYIQ